MKRTYLVELGTESITLATDDPVQWEFDDLDEAISFYDDIDLRHNWISEYNTSHGNSRHKIMEKQLIDCIDFDDGNVGYLHILRFEEYGETDYRMEEED